MTTVAVVDTNVVVSGLLTADATAPTAVILDRMLSGRLSFLLSDALIAEYRNVLLRKNIAKAHGRSPSEIDSLLTELIANGMVRDPSSYSMSAPDPGDEHLWALVATHPGAVLVTGDQLLIDKPPKRTRAVSPRTFVDHLTAR